jgi:2-hydroxy-6-oxonona-2,4-dienedioate hydrolase
MHLTGLARKPVAADLVRVGSDASTPRVVFLHGLVGLNEHWDAVVRQLPQSRRELLQLPLLGLRGDDCSIDGAAALTADFLRQTNAMHDRPVIVGNSFGGHVALKIAVEHPHLIRGLVLAGASGLIEKSIVADVQIRPSREWLQRKIGELFYDQSKMNPDDVERAFAELSDRGSARAMVKLSRSARRNHMGDVLPQITAPTLIIWGRQDIVTPPEAADEMLAKIRGSRIHWLEKCGHAPMIEAPEAFAAAMREFLGRLA